MLTIEQFGAFYGAVHRAPDRPDRRPFPWQQRLLEHVAGDPGTWPASIQAPTAGGKTSVLDIAVFQLALEAQRPAHQRNARLRTFFVIDRRVVVDEAYEHARGIACALRNSEDSVVREVAAALRQFGGARPLLVRRLRGGTYPQGDWADQPNQPLLCIATVDQVGSRLLFRGYQVSREAWPVNAGLIGHDARIILDEAHLSRPFADTVTQVREHFQQVERVPAPGLDLVVMSATLSGPGTTVAAGDKDFTDEELGKRLTRPKPAALREPAKSFEGEAAAAVRELLAREHVQVVGAVLNTVASARAVFEDLRRTAEKEQYTAVLLTGRNRPHCTDKLWAGHKKAIAVGAARTDRRYVVVATQTIEVGANLDFDALVTEAAPLDALRQRFGRLNRMGSRISAPAVILRRPKETPVYGEATTRTWAFLRRSADAGNTVNFGVRAMDELVAAFDRAEQQKQDEGGAQAMPQPHEQLLTTRPEGPLLFREIVDLWAQTSPPPAPDPDVAPFLHGAAALDAAEVSLVWRELPVPGADTSEPDLLRAWWERVRMAPPTPGEMLALPLPAVRRWLRGDPQAAVADVEGPPADEDGEDEALPGKEPPRKRRALLWRGPDEEPRAAARLRPGDVVVVPCAEGGCDEFGWHPASTAPVRDIGDEAHNERARQAGRRGRWRLLPDRLQPGAELDPPVADTFTELADYVEEQHPLADAPTELNRFLVRQPEWKGAKPAATLSLLTPELAEPVQLADPGWRHGTVLTWRYDRPEDPDDEEDDPSLGGEREIELQPHLDRVAGKVRAFAAGCGLSETLVEDLVLAARLHDVGKNDVRFQAWLRGGSLAKAFQHHKKPLAKSEQPGKLSPAELARTRELAGYPKNGRHEAASVRLVEAAAAHRRAHDPELVLHLIGTHHGHGRPWWPQWEEPAGVTVTAEMAGQEVTAGTGHDLTGLDPDWLDRFGRLQQRYGPWGLAYLEAILRRADAVVSREDEHG